MADPRAKHFAKLHRLRASARRWTVAAVAFGAATLVLLPYHGIGLPDAMWAAVAAGSVAVAKWRWSDYREMAAMPPPEAIEPAQRMMLAQKRLASVVGKWPVGGRAISEIHRFQHLSRLRGSSVAASAARLDRAMRALAALTPRLTGPGCDVLLEASVAEGALRDLAERTASVERALKVASPNDPARTQLVSAHADLLGRFDTGVTAYEGLVTAAGAVVAEMGRIGEPVAVDRLVEATDRLRGVASGIAEFSATQPHIPDLA